MCNPRQLLNQQSIDEDEQQQQQQPQLFATMRPEQDKTGKTNDGIGRSLVAAPLAEASMLIPASLPVAFRQNTTAKPKSPGAPQHHLHYVRHDYHDYANVVCEETCRCEPLDVSESGRVNGVNPSFPMRLHIMLEAIEKSGQTHIVSWQPHGRCFRVHKPKEFVELVLSQHFQQTKLPSFQRQLNLYGFCRLTAGPDMGSYYHELFLRGKACLARGIQRMKIKGNGVRPRSNPNQEPNFYNMAPIPKKTPAMIAFNASVATNNNNNSNNNNNNATMALSAFLGTNFSDRIDTEPSEKKVLQNSGMVVRTSHNEPMQSIAGQSSDPMDFAGRKFHFVDPTEVERRNSTDNALFLRKLNMSTSFCLDMEESVDDEERLKTFIERSLL